MSFNQKYSPSQGQDAEFPSITSEPSHNPFQNDQDRPHPQVFHLLSQQTFTSLQQQSNDVSQRSLPKPSSQPELKMSEVMEESESDSSQEDYGQYNVSHYIDKLAEIKRERLKTEHPTASPVHFMNRKEKKKFFREINVKFHDSIQKMPQKIKKTKKILKFNNKYEVLPFSEEQSVIQLAPSQKIRENHENEIDQN